MSLEQRLKVSNSRKNKGLKNTNGFKLGSIGYNKGKKFTEDHKVKLSLAKKGKPSPRKGIIMGQHQKDLIRLTRIGKKSTLESKEKNRQSQYKRHFDKNPDYIPDGWLDLRRKRIKESNSFHSIGEWETLKIQYNFTCPSCKKQEPNIKLTRDHIIPISKGGSDNIENIQPLCHSCNCRKHTKIIKY